MISKQQKAEIIKQFGGKENNTGSPSVQIALLTAEINLLSKHFQEHPKDLHSKYGFIAKIEKRKRLINYLKRHDFEQYQKTIEQLNLRK